MSEALRITGTDATKSQIALAEILGVTDVCRLLSYFRARLVMSEMTTHDEMSKI